MTTVASILYDDSAPDVLAGEADRCVERAKTALRGLPASPFHIALELTITNLPAGIAAHLDRFITQEEGRFEVGAIYVEMNGFSINPGRWFFDAFAFEEYGGHDDYDWLADWQSGGFPDMTLTGLEPLQAIYNTSTFRDQRHREAREITDLLVVFLFQELISRASKHMSKLQFPLLATAHDYDLIQEISPRS